MIVASRLWLFCTSRGRAGRGRADGTRDEAAQRGRWRSGCSCPELQRFPDSNSNLLILRPGGVAGCTLARSAARTGAAGAAGAPEAGADASRDCALTLSVLRSEEDGTAHRDLGHLDALLQRRVARRAPLDRCRDRHPRAGPPERTRRSPDRCRKRSPTSSATPTGLARVYPDDSPLPLTVQSTTTGGAGPCTSTDPRLRAPGLGPHIGMRERVTALRRPAPAAPGRRLPVTPSFPPGHPSYHGSCYR